MAGFGDGLLYIAYQADLYDGGKRGAFEDV